MVAHRQRVVALGYFMRLMIWFGVSVPCSVSSLRIVVSVIEPAPWVEGEIGLPLMAAMSTALPEEWAETLPDAVVAVAAVQAGDGRLQAVGGEEDDHGEHAAVDDARLDVAAAAGVDLDALVVQDAALQVLLAHEQELADARVVRAACRERAAVGGAVDRGRLEQLPPVEDRLRDRCAARSCPPGGPRSAGTGRRRCSHGADAAEDRAGDDLAALDERLERHVVAVQAVVDVK